MIKKVEIKNFRNIKSLELDLTKTSIITGKNNLGKSNTLNAINWLITDTLLTDKYGSGENDNDSIIPVDAVKGDITEVSITLESGAVFTRTIKKDYDKNDKYTGTTPKFKINSEVIDTKKAFYEALYMALGFIPRFTKLKVNEVRLFTDPLYALLKLDYKELRKVLVEMGCSVSNQELYASGFSDLAKYEAKYNGKWWAMRKELRANNKNFKKELDDLDAQISLFSAVPTNNDDLDSLQAQKTEFIKQREILAKGDTTALDRLNLEIKEKQLDLDTKVQNYKSNIQIEINNVENQILNLYKTNELEKSNATLSIRDEINKTQSKLNEVNEKKANLRLTNASLEFTLKHINFEIDKLTLQKSDLSEQVGKIFNDEEVITCPHCGEEIHLHQDEIDSKIQELSSKMNDLDIAIEDNRKKFNENKVQFDSTTKDLEKVEEEIKTIRHDLEVLNIKKAAIESEYIIDNRQLELEATRKELENKLNHSYEQFKAELDAIDLLSDEKRKIIANAEQVNQQKIEYINHQIYNLDEQIRAVYIYEEKMNQKQELVKTRETTTKAWNDNDNSLGRVNDLIKAMISRINAKALALTGFKFVMLEENLTNDDISEVCYVVDENGVPFKDINTARKVEMGIQFIESVKRVCGVKNELPIMADRLEGIDDINKIDKFTNSQLICTRVSMDDSLKLV